MTRSLSSIHTAKTPKAPTPNREVWLNVLAVIAALAVVHILGRFIFTPLMPYFINDGLFDLTQATDLASMNYLGYLVGAWLAIFAATPKFIKKILIFNIIINILSTLWQATATDFHLLLALRLINGVSNGVVFVLAPAFMLEWLYAQGKAHLSGLMYFGVSAGLVLSGLLVHLTAPYFDGADRWLPVAVLSVIFGLFCVYRLATVQVHLPQVIDNKQKPPLFDGQSTFLFLAYLGAGFGYILPMTFLPTLAYQLHADGSINTYLWTLVAMTCLVSTSLWNKLGVRIGDYWAIVISLVLQGLGVFAVLIMPNAWGLLACALGVGGGFLGTVMCTQRYARSLQPSQGVKLSAVLITVYAGAQLIAPMMAKWWIAHGASLLMTFWLGFAAFVWSLVMMALIKKSPNRAI